jgi:dihydroneopterin triphosphate diphosphatase
MGTRAEIAVFVVRSSDGRVLLVHRSPQQGGYWHVVAGGVEPGETAAEAAERELQEETGLVAGLTAGFDVVEHVDSRTKEPAGRARLHDPDVVQVAVTCFVAYVPRGWEPKLDREHDQHRWCDPDEAVDALRWPGTAGALRQLVAGAAW